MEKANGNVAIRPGSNPVLSFKEAQSDFNEKVSQGWSMENDCCPISGYPLLRNPNTGVLWSAPCQMEVRRRGFESAGESTETGSKEFEDTQDQSQQIAEKLALGWGLTGEICPVTGKCPLLHDPELGFRWSATLGKHLDGDGQIIEQINAPVHDGQKARTVSISRSKEEGSGTMAALSRSNSSSDQISKRIGDKLLAGWTMLSENCPKTNSCPLMYDPVTKKKWSAAVNDYVAEKPEHSESSAVINADKLSSFNLVHLESNTPLVQTTKVTESNSNNAYIDKKVALRKQNFLPDVDFDKQSKLLGDKLLNGWTMLERVCPISGQVPLMMEPKTGVMYSAALDRCLSEEEVNGNQSGLSCNSHAPDTLSQSRIPDRNASSFTNRRVEPEWKRLADAQLEQDYRDLNNSALNSSLPESAVAAVSPGSKAVCENAKTALLSKINESSQALSRLQVDETSSVSELKQVEQLVELIGSSFRILKSLPDESNM